MSDKWTERWLDRAASLAAWSKDPSTKVGAVLVRESRAISEGYNGFPVGFADTPERLDDRTLKYALTVHAEANAVAFAARSGISTRGTALYTTFPVCPNCATLVIQAGVQSVIVGAALIRRDWIERTEQGLAVFREAAIPYDLSRVAVDRGGYAVEAVALLASLRDR